MKKILVTQRIILDKKTKTIRDSLDHELVKFLIKNDFFIIPVPNFFPSKNRAGRRAPRVDARREAPAPLFFTRHVLTFLAYERDEPYALRGHRFHPSADPCRSG